MSGGVVSAVAPDSIASALDIRPGDVLLSVDHVSADNDRGLPALKDVTLQVRSGEVLGLAGVAGNGQSELAEVIQLAANHTKFTNVQTQGNATGCVGIALRGINNAYLNVPTIYR